MCVYCVIWFRWKIELILTFGFVKTGLPVCLSVSRLLSGQLNYMDPDGAFLLDRLSSAADEINGTEDERRKHEDLLGLAQTLLDPSTPSGEVSLR